MKNISLQSRTLSYTEYVAHALIHFAEGNQAFRAWFVSAIPEFPNVEHCGEEVFSPTPPLTILHEDVAVRKALWLLDTTQRDMGVEARRTQGMLATWKHAQARDEYSVIILGLKYGVLNYGIFGHPKRYHEPLDIVIRDEYAQTTPVAKLLQNSLQLGMSIVEQGLVAAGGIAGKLEPELHDWLFGEKKVVLHTCAPNTLESLFQELQTLKVPAAFHTNEQGVSMLAISPAIYLNDLKHSSALNVFEDEE